LPISPWCAIIGLKKY